MNHGTDDNDEINKKEKDHEIDSDDDDDVVFDLTQDDDGDDDTQKKSQRLANAKPSKEEENDDDDEDDDDNDFDLLNLSPVFLRRTNTVNSSLSSSSSLSARTTSLGATTTATTTTTSTSTKRKRSSNNTTTKKQQQAKLAQEKRTKREAERLLKKQKKEQEKQLKAELKIKEEQADGKFAMKEICVLFSDKGKAIAGGSNADESLGRALLESLKEQKYLYGIIKGERERMGSVRDVCCGEACVCIRWVRKDFLLGGAKSAASKINGCAIPADAEDNDLDNISNNAALNTVINNSNNPADVQRMDIVSFLFYDAGVFLDLLERCANAEMRDDYPKMRAWLRGVRATLEADWEVADCSSGADVNDTKMVPSRIILVLHNVQYELNRRWNDHEKAARGRGRGKKHTTTSISSNSPKVLINEEELHDAVSWLLMEQNVECTLTSTIDDTVQHIVGITKSLSQLPYYEDATELHCIKKLKPDADATTPYEKAKDCWRRQLRQIPMVSEVKAAKLVEKFPTMRSLMDVYEDPFVSEEEKRKCLASCLDDGRNHFKMSDCIYRLMTSADPDELI